MAHIRETTPTPETLLQEVMKNLNKPKHLIRLAQNDFKAHASLQPGTDADAPFIIWPAINREPYQPWLPVLMAAVAAYRIKNQIQITGSHLVVFSTPASTTWYTPHIQQNNIFENLGYKVCYPRVLKSTQLDDEKINEAVVSIQVPSYVHNRQKDGTRGDETMYIFNPEVFLGATAVVIDDVIAQGLTQQTLATTLRDYLEATQVIAVSAMSKEMQGGRQALCQSGLVDQVITLVNITRNMIQNGQLVFPNGQQ